MEPVFVDETRIIVDRSNGSHATFATSPRTSGHNLVDVAGYVPKAEQLNILNQSGRALEEYRKKVYSHLEPADSPEPEYDPTTHKGYDVFDCHADITFAKSAMRKSAKLAADLAEKERLAKESAAAVAAELASTAKPVSNTVAVDHVP